MDLALRIGMRVCCAVLAIPVLVGDAAEGRALGGSEPEDFFMGAFADGGHSSQCTRARIDESIPVQVWASVPLGHGIRYVTLRFRLSSNLRFAGRAHFHSNVTNVIRVDYADGTQEWTLFFSSCEEGWVQLYHQDFAVVNGAPAALEIIASGSMIRDCSFVLNRLVVAGSLAINGSSCAGVRRSRIDWGDWKARY